ncbi:glyoxalase-like domain-containing protein [Irpex rosettiformis]|uniref:Glyoxalase-like domain-containing protein n=1 Tax=Irpex rosettiformis TaxID=378272 RepID=A0ACB8U982_9APHY|nr:glyoxalase-like domain-containing protein [Irpex rosettiformis]
MSSSPSTRILDHIVHLVPPGTLPQAIQRFRDLGFTVNNGGTHAGGLTANALVIFSDGVYLELIHFTRELTSDDLTRSPWANKPPGFIAFAFLGSPGSSPSITSIINDRAEALGIGDELQYLEPTPGGRTRPDGELLKWEIVAPARWAERRNAIGRPFYCGDVTPRKLRVPLDEDKRVHPNKTCGVAFLRVLASKEAFEEKSKEIQAALGVPPVTANAIDGKLERAWVLESPYESEATGARLAGSRLILAAANLDDADEVRFVEENGTGVFEVGFAIEAGGGNKETRTPYAKIAWVKV